MESVFSLKGSVVVITGGYGHLGKGMVNALLNHGASVIVCGRSEKKFLTSFKHLKKESLHFEFCDVGDADSIREAFDQIAKKYKKIDVLINNAFFSSGQSPEHMSDEDWDFGIRGVLSSVFKCIREIIPFFKENKAGKIINVSSMYGILAPDFKIYDRSPEFLNPPHYGAAKAGVVQLTKYYASYLGKFNINVNCLSPGPFPSDTVQRDSNFMEELCSKTSLNRIGKPEDLGGSLVFLASKASDYITGHNLVVDGGWTIK